MKNLILMCLLAHFGTPLWAAYIQMQTTAEPVQIVNGKGVLKVTLTNQGDEAAYSVMVEPRLPEGFTVEATQMTTLAVNRPFTQTLAVRTTRKTKGVYPATLLVRYADANGYPFSAVSPLMVYQDTAAPGDIHLRGNPLQFPQKGRGTLTFEVFNRSTQAKDIRLSWTGPLELRFDAPEKSIAIPAQASLKVKGRLSDVGALPGSSFAVLLMASYEDAGRLYTTSATTLVKIGTPRNWMLLTIYGIGGLLLVGFVGSWLVKRLSRPKKHA